MPSAAYEIALRHRSGPLNLEVHFTLNAPWTALFAPSGAGKTTILRMIAGLDKPASGRIVAPSGNVLLDTATGIDISTHKRRIRMITQRPALFPHLSVIRNVSYGEPAGDAHDDPLSVSLRFDETMDLCRISHLRRKMPSQLSGGERQRVALARALASFPADLLLLDEPFTGLEADLRDTLIQDLRVYLAARGTPVLLVTHDLGEVFAANALVLKMEVGRIVAQGSAAEVLAAERTRLLERLNPS